MLEPHSARATSFDLRSRRHALECDIHGLLAVLPSVFIKYGGELLAHGWEVRGSAYISGHFLTKGQITLGLYNSNKKQIIRHNIIVHHKEAKPKIGTFD
jgi:hypothetical protein